MKIFIFATFALMGFMVLSSPAIYAKASKKQIHGKLNLNNASAEQIDQLPGISPKKAQDVVDYRKEHPFKSVDELDQVKGFTPKTIGKLKPYLAIEGATNLSVEGGNSKKGSKKQHLAKKGK